MLCSQLRRRRNNDHDVDKLVWASRKNIVITGVPDRGRRYLSDFYTTLIDIKWRWNLLFFVVGFVLTWLLFAVYYYLLCFLHGDLDLGNKQDNVTWTPCVENVYSFTEAYLFSIETMSTIGYGFRYQTEECPGVYLAVMLQSVIGAGLQFALASLVVSKTRRANRFSQTILFSNTAVVYMEDGRLKLAVRIGDMRKGDVIGAHATGMLIKKTTGREGHRVPVRMFTVPFEAEGGRQKLFLCWPCLLIHSVDQHSPFWSLSREDLMNDTYELIVILDGVAATSSKPFQARKSYHSWEILWGRRFKALTISDDDRNSSGYVVNYNTFNDTYAVSIPFCSAQDQDRERLLREIDCGEHKDQEDFHEYYYADEPVDKCKTGLRSEKSENTTDDAKSPSSESDSKDDALTSEDVTLQTDDDDDESHKADTACALEALPQKAVDKFIGRVALDPRRKYSDTLHLRSPKMRQSEMIVPNMVAPKDRVRRISRVEFQPFPFAGKGTLPQRRLSLGDAVNMYRHRRSVTDTYLGTGLPEEESEECEASAAIISIVSQQSRSQQEGKSDPRDAFKQRRKSTTLELMFGPEGADNDSDIK